MTQVDGLSYREWQQRNSQLFKALSKKEQQKARKAGYHNVGWLKVQKSWSVLQKLRTPSLFEVKLNKGDVAGAIDQAILGAEQAQDLARQAIDDLEASQQRSREEVAAALDRYQLL